MARKRLIAPQFFQHSGLFDAEQATRLPIRFAFSGLWGQTDRRGVFAWRPRELKVAIMPYDEGVDMSAVLDALEAHGFVRSYEANGKRYGFIPSFKDWQTFHKDERPSADPAPPPELVQDSSYAAPAASNPQTQGEIFDQQQSAPGSHGAGTSAAPGQHGANMPIAVAVPVASAVAMTSAEGADAPPSSSSSDVPSHGEQPTAHGVPHAVAIDERAAMDLLFAEHSPHQRAMALDVLRSIASGKGKHRVAAANRVAGEREVLQALVEMAINRDAWHIDRFKGYVRRICKKPIDQDLTEDERHTRRVLSLVRPQPHDDNADAAQRSEDRRRAMDGFRALYRQPAAAGGGLVMTS